MTILYMNTAEPFWQSTCYVYNVDGWPIFQPLQNLYNFIALEVCTLLPLKRKLTLKILKSNPGNQRVVVEKCCKSTRQKTCVKM